jgi:hypothetical protein
MSVIKADLVKNWQKIIYLILLLCLLAPLLAYAYIGSYSRFMADDYGSATIARSKGIIGGMIYWYQNWFGRFSAIYLDGLFGSIGPGITPYVPPIVIAIWLTVLIIVIYQLTIGMRKQSRYLAATLISTAILITAFEITPTVAQSVYWGQGMRTVVPPLILGTVYIGVLQYYQNLDPPKKQPYYWFFLCGGITLIAGGFSETYLALQTSALAIVLLLLIFHIMPVSKRELTPLIASGFIGSIIALVIVALAPGNQIRQAYYPPPPGLLQMLGIMGGSTARFYLRLLSTSYLKTISGIVTLSGVVGYSQYFSDHDNISEKNLKRILVLLPLSTIFLIYSSFAPGAYAMSGGPPFRTWIIPVYVFVCSLSAWGYIVGKLIYKTHQHKENKHRKLWVSMVCCFLVLYMGSAISATIRILQLEPEYSTYAAMWDESDELIRTAKNDGFTTVIIPETTNWAGLKDIGSNPDHWVNQFVSNYYGIQVLIEPSSQK